MIVEALSYLDFFGKGSETVALRLHFLERDIFKFVFFVFDAENCSEGPLSQQIFGLPPGFLELGADVLDFLFPVDLAGS